MENRILVFDLDDTLIDTSGQMRSGKEWDDIKRLKLLEGVRGVLNNPNYRKMLVTKENVPGLQKAKLYEIGIYNLFENVFICSSCDDKRQYFERIGRMSEGGNIWAIGDRIDSEIRHANRLGWKTVLMKRGKYKNLEARDYLEVPDYGVNDFFELGNLLYKK